MDTTEKALDTSYHKTGSQLTGPQLRQLNKFGGRVNKFGVNFAVFDVDGGLILLSEGGRFGSDRQQLIMAGQQALEQCGNRGDVETEDSVYRSGENNQILAGVLKSGDKIAAVDLIDLGGRSTGEDANYEMQDEFFGEMLLLLAENFQTAGSVEEQIEMIGTELAQVYEELVLLHKLSANMKVTEPDVNFLQMACDNLTDIVSVEGIAVLLERTLEDDEKRLILAAGSGLIDINERMVAVLQGRLTEEISSGKEALLDSEVDSPFRYDWPDSIGNIIAVPLCGKDEERHFAGDAHSSNRIIGLMVAINRVDKPDFDSIDVKLFNSVAGSCAVFIENGRLFKDLKELFIGSLKALTSSIDAKDPYTRGHSERVAFISRWIAERFAAERPLKEEQIHKIYLAGLLHDIGKMGVDDVVLRKKGKLTVEEFNCIKTHPSIGAGILSGIKQMRDIVPGVLYHHERVDGKGYPSGLVGERIPLIGRIIGLADSFDAMTSKRTYRGALTVKQAMGEIRKGLGTQFDEKVARVFLDSDVYQLWDIMQDGFNGIYQGDDSGEYGTVAVGSIIR